MSSPSQRTAIVRLSPKATMNLSAPLSGPTKTLTQSPCLCMHCKWKFRKQYWPVRPFLALILIVVVWFCILMARTVLRVSTNSPCTTSTRSSSCHSCTENNVIVHWIKEGLMPAKLWNARSLGCGASTTSKICFTKDWRSKPCW